MQHVPAGLEGRASRSRSRDRRTAAWRALPCATGRGRTGGRRRTWRRCEPLLEEAPRRRRSRRAGWAAPASSASASIRASPGCGRPWRRCRARGRPRHTRSQHARARSRSRERRARCARTRPRRRRGPRAGTGTARGARPVPGQGRQPPRRTNVRTRAGVTPGGRSGTTAPCGPSTRPPRSRSGWARHRLRRAVRSPRHRSERGGGRRSAATTSAAPDHDDGTVVAEAGRGVVAEPLGQPVEAGADERLGPPEHPVDAVDEGPCHGPR